MELPAEITWDENVQQRIKDAVLAEAGSVRVSQKAIHARVLADRPTEVPLDVLALPDIRIAEGQTRPFVELSVEFSLTTTQVQKEPERQLCLTLARMAAKEIALAEDMIIFQGRNGILPANVRAEQRDAASDGLLGTAAPKDADDNDPNRVSEPIDVPLATDGRPSVLWGENIFTAVADGISKLEAKGQAPEYALFLPRTAYADTHRPPADQSLVTPADRIRPMVLGGYYGTGMLPPNRGLLVALGGEPIVIYVGQEAELEYVRQEGRNHIFRASERFLQVAIDPRACVQIALALPATAATVKK